MTRRKRRKITAKFNADAARLVTTGAKTVAEVVNEFDLTETALREWVRRAKADEGAGPPDALTTSERAELIELRKRSPSSPVETLAAHRNVRSELRLAPDYVYSTAGIRQGAALVRREISERDRSLDPSQARLRSRKWVRDLAVLVA
ncbi:MAG: transposase [Deltaproteobacteria bacterium]|nr:transposase [Deltaproteobacteria bacterium]